MPDNQALLPDVFYRKLPLFDRLGCGILRIRETREPGGLPSFIGGAYPPDERKEGDANVCYIL